MDYRPYLPKNGYIEIHEEVNGDTNLVYPREKNLFVNDSFSIMSDLLVNGNTNKKISGIAIGSGGIINSVIQTPLVTDTELYTEIYRKYSIESIVISSTTTPKYIDFKFKIDLEEGNGTNGVVAINEIGLISSDGTMFSRKILSTEIIKNNTKKLLINWKLEF